MHLQSGCRRFRWPSQAALAQRDGAPQLQVRMQQAAQAGPWALCTRSLQRPAQAAMASSDGSAYSRACLPAASGPAAGLGQGLQVCHCLHL